MAEMLVRLYDKYTGKDQVMRSKTTHRGDVIVVREDGWPWSDQERKSPDWIILTVNMPIQKAQTMLAPEQGDPLKNPLLQLRAFKVDLDALTVLGVPVQTAKDAMLAKFPLTDQGIKNGVKDPSTDDPMGEILASVQAGDRIHLHDAEGLQVKTLPIAEAQFDAAKALKPAITDLAIIGDDPGVIG